MEKILTAKNVDGTISADIIVNNNILETFAIVSFEKICVDNKEFHINGSAMTAVENNVNLNNVCDSIIENNIIVNDNINNALIVDVYETSCKTLTTKILSLCIIKNIDSDSFCATIDSRVVYIINGQPANLLNRKTYKYSESINGYFVCENSGTSFLE